MKIIVLVLFFFSLISCSKTVYKFQENIDMVNQDIRLLGLNNNCKQALKKLHKQLYSSEHIIIYYRLEPEWNSKKFEIIIKDVSNRKYYKVFNNNKKNIKIRSKNSFDINNNLFEKFVMESFEFNNFDHIIKISKQKYFSGIQTNIYLFNLDSFNKQYDFKSVKDFGLENEEILLELEKLIELNKRLK